MKPLISLSLLFLIATLRTTAQTAEEHYKNGVTHLSEHRYPQAITELDQAISMNPSYTQAWYFRGLTKYMMEDSSATGDFTRVIALQPDHYKAWCFRAMVKFREGDYATAKKDLDKSIEIYPGYSESWFYRGDAKMELDDYDGAIADIDKCLALRPEHGSALYVKGMALYLKKDYTAAIATLDHILGMNDPGHRAGSYYYKGMSEIGLKMTDAACRDLGKAKETGYADAPAAITKYCH